MAIKKTDYLKFGDDLFEIVPPLPSGNDRGGIIASPKESTDTVEIKLGDDGKLYAPAYPDLTDINLSEIQAQLDEISSNKANKSDLETHTNNNEIHISESDREKIIETYNHSQMEHAPSDAEKNIIVSVLLNGEELSVDDNRQIHIVTPTLFVQGTSKIYGDDFLLEDVATVADDGFGNVLLKCVPFSEILVEDDNNGNVRLTI